MDETAALSPTSSIDCFSDTEIDIDGPPAVAIRKVDETPEVSARIDKTGSKLESSIAEINNSSSNKSMNETRDSEHSSQNDENKIDQLRDSFPDAIEEKIVADPISSEKTSFDPESSDVVKPCLSAESINAKRSHVTVVSNATMESVETLSKFENKAKSFETANWPIAISKTSSFALNDSIKNDPSQMSDVTTPASVAKSTSQIESPEPTEHVEELTVLKKPTVSFADEASQSDHATIERKGSGSSKKSVKSRMSLFSSRKSKDSASASKSLKSNKSGKPPIAPMRVEPRVVEEANCNVDNPDAENDTTTTDDGKSVASVTIDIPPEDHMVALENPPPPQPLEVRQGSLKSSRSKSSVASSKSNKVVPLATQASSNSDKKKTRESSSVTSPKLYGPPQQLPQWGGIPKSEKSVASKKSTVAQSEKEPSVVDHLGKETSTDDMPVLQDELKASPFVETAPLKEDVMIATNDLEEVLPAGVGNKDIDVCDNVFSPPQSPVVVGPPRSLAASISNKSNRSKPDEEVTPEGDLAGEHLIDATSTLSSKSSKQNEIDETSEAAMSTHIPADHCNTDQTLSTPVEEAHDVDAKSDNVKQLTVEVHDDPIQAVMKPFSPIEVPVCVSIEDAILKHAVLDGPPSEDVVPVEKASEMESSNDANMIRNSKPYHTFLRRMLPKAKHVIPLKNTSVEVVQCSDCEIVTPAPKSMNVISKLMSPKRSSIVESETSIEVEAAKSTSLSKSAMSSKYFGIFKRSPSNAASGNTASTMHINSVHDLNVTPSLLPLANIPVESNSTNVKNIAIESGSQSMDMIYVGNCDNEIPDSTEPVIDVEKDSFRSKNTKANQKRKSSLFGRTKASNETKRQIAKKFRQKSRSQSTKQREHDVKLSAKIDEKIFVENLHVTCSESSQQANKTANENMGTSISNAVKSVRNDEAKQSVETADQAAPIIVVDHRSSKKVEAFGKFEIEAQTECLQEPQIRIPKILLPNIKTSQSSTDDENNRLYTSDDTVTETELTEVAKLDVPFDEEQNKNISDAVSDDNIDDTTTENSEVVSSMKSGNKNNQNSSDIDTAWITNLIDWCTPRASTDINKWMNCAGQEVTVTSVSDPRATEEATKKEESTILDEVISEFNECHDFYADTLNLKTNRGEVDQQTAVPGSDWGTQFINWMSPKSRQVVVETTEEARDETENELLEQKEFIPSIPEDKVNENSDHEGTEIALTNSEHVISRRPGYSPFKGVFGKPIRSPFNKGKGGLPLRVTRFQKKGLGTHEVVNEPVKENAQHEKAKRVYSMRHFFRNKASLPKQSKQSELAICKVEEGLPVVIEEDTSKELPKIEEKQTDPKNAALFTFMSDDIVTEAEQPIRAEALPESHVKMCDEVESSVNYLEMVKSKRQSRRQKMENGQDEVADFSVQAQEIIDDLVNSNPTAKITKTPNEENDIAYKYRVNAVSDEVVEDMKLSLSEATFSIVGDSVLSSIDEKQENATPIAKAVRENLATKRVAPTRSRKGIPSTKTNRFLSRRKEEDSVGVSVNSDMNSFNDDLSVAFAPAVGKWLW